jgi:outer membrane receptor protein involved in Fe transport
MSVSSSGIRVARCSALLLVLLLPRGTAAQPHALSGRVVSAETAEPLSDVLIRLEATTRATVTGADGRFTFSPVPAGPYVLVAQRLGLATERRELRVGDDGTPALEIIMREEATVIAPVVVSATREHRRRAEGSVTIDALDGAEVRRTRATHPAGIMNRLAGVHVSELSGEGHSMAIRQPITTKPMYLFLEDGVPTRPTGFFNHNALYEVNIPQSGGIEVKGPGTALYGSDAIGGVINVLTRPAPATPSVEALVEGGTFGYRRVLASGGLTTGGHGLRADLNVTHSDNWKEQAPFDRQSATIRWDAPIGSRWSAKTIVTGSRIDQQDVPAISRAQFTADPALNTAPIAYRRVRAFRVSSELQREAGRTLWTVTPFARINRMELLPSWQIAFDPQTWDTRNASVGLLAKWRRDFIPLRARIIVGADLDVSPGSFVAKRAIVSRASPSAPWTSYTDGETQYDYDVTYQQASPYVHLELSPLPRVRVDAGVRADVARYRYENALSALDTGAHRRPASTTTRYDDISSKLGATVEVARWLNVFGSYRQGFRAPSQGQLFQQNAAANTVGLEPVRVASHEAGVRGEIGRRVVYQLSGYDMTIRDDILTYQSGPTTREAVNAGKTRHKGIEMSAGVALATTLRFDASYALGSHRYVEWAVGTTSTFSGHRIEQAPRELGSAVLGWSPRALRGGRLAIEWARMGRYAMNPENTRTYGGHEFATVHGNVFLRPGVELFGRLSNVFDRQYAELAAFDRFRGEEITPGAPRALNVGARVSWPR